MTKRNKALKKTKPDIGESGPVNEEELGQIGKQNIEHMERVREKDEVRLAAHIREVMLENGVDPDTAIITGIDYSYPKDGPVEATPMGGSVNSVYVDCGWGRVCQECGLWEGNGHVECCPNILSGPGVPVQFGSYDLAKQYAAAGKSLPNPEETYPTYREVGEVADESYQRATEVLEAEQRRMEKEQLAEDTGNDRRTTPSFERGSNKGYEHLAKAMVAPLKDALRRPSRARIETPEVADEFYQQTKEVQEALQEAVDAEDRRIFAEIEVAQKAKQRRAFIKSIQVDAIRRAAGKLYDINDKHWHYLNELADAVRDGEEEL